MTDKTFIFITFIINIIIKHHPTCTLKKLYTEYVQYDALWKDLKPDLTFGQIIPNEWMCN